LPKIERCQIDIKLSILSGQNPTFDKVVLAEDLVRFAAIILQPGSGAKGPKKVDKKVVVTTVLRHYSR